MSHGIMEKFVAHKELLGVLKDGSKLNIHFHIGKPYQINAEAWACPVSLTGIHNLSNEIHGIDSFQSLLLAINLIKKLLSYFIEDGGTLYWPNSEEQISIDELFEINTNN